MLIVALFSKGEVSMLKRLLVSVMLSLVVVCGAGATNNPLITVDEDGNGTLQFSGAPSIATHGVLAPDPGPGGLPLALTYNLLGPPGLVAGDVLVFEDSTFTELSDIIRFNPAGTGNAAYPASLVFYSDNVDGIDNLADVGFPIARYPNVVRLLEADIGGGQIGLHYTPTENQPGFVPGFGVTYHAISDGEAARVPEPITTTLLGIGLAGIAVSRRRQPKQVATR